MNGQYLVLGCPEFWAEKDEMDQMIVAQVFGRTRPGWMATTGARGVTTAAASSDRSLIARVAVSEDRKSGNRFLAAVGVE